MNEGTFVDWILRVGIMLAVVNIAGITIQFFLKNKELVKHNSCVSPEPESNKQSTKFDLDPSTESMGKVTSKKYPLIWITSFPEQKPIFEIHSDGWALYRGKRVFKDKELYKVLSKMECRQ